MSDSKLNSSKGRCQSITKAGKPCRAAATEGGLCYFHANPAKAVELGRIGGRKNGRVQVEEVPELPKLDSVCALRDALAQMIADVHRRRLHPSAAAGLAQLSNALIRTMQVTNIEASVKEMEETRDFLLQSIQAEASKA